MISTTTGVYFFVICTLWSPSARRGAGILLIGWIWWSISCIYDVIYDVTVHIEGVSRV